MKCSRKNFAFTNCRCFLLDKKKLKKSEKNSIPHQQLLCCIKYRFLTYLIIPRARANISSSSSSNAIICWVRVCELRWDGVEKEKEKRCVTCLNSIAWCECARAARRNLSIARSKRMFVHNTSVRVCECLQWLIRVDTIT